MGISEFLWRHFMILEDTSCSYEILEDTKKRSLSYVAYSTFANEIH